MSWVGLGTAAVGVVGTIVSSRNAKKNAGQTAPPLDIKDISKQSIQGNIENEPDIEALLRKSNAFNQSQNTNLLNMAIPGYDKIAGNLSGVAEHASADPYALPKGFADNLTRLAAERGISTGQRGQAQDFSLLRDFGVNQLQYGQQNIQNSQSILATLAGIGKVNPMSPLSFFSTPGQALGAAGANQDLAQSGINSTNAANQYATANTWSGISQLAGAAATAYGKYKAPGASGDNFNLPSIDRKTGPTFSNPYI